MKHLFLATSLALSLSCGAALAQTAAAPQDQAPMQNPGYGHRHHHAMDPERQTAHLSQRLNLSPDQASRIEPILASRDQQLAGLRNNPQLSPEDRHQQMHLIHQQARRQMEAILSPDQAAALRQMHHHHHGAGDGPAPQAPSM